MNKNYKDMGKNIVILILTMFLPKMINFVLVPLYTNQLSTVEYGIADMLTSIVSLLFPIFVLNIHDAVVRFSADYEECNNAVYTVGIKVIRRGEAILILGSIFLFIIFRVNHIRILSGWYYLYIWIDVYLSAMWATKTYFCRGIDNTKCLLYGSTMQSLSLGIFSILLIVGFGWKLKGYLVALLLSKIIGVSIVQVKGNLNHYYNGKIKDMKLTKNMLKYSFPFVFSALSYWVNNASDRYILRLFSDNSSVGILAVAYKIPAIIVILSSVLIYAFQVSLIKESQEDDPTSFITNCYKAIRVGGVLASSGLILLNVFIAKIMFAKEFFQAWEYVPPLILAVFGNLMAMMCQQTLLPSKKSGLMGVQGIISALLNIILNFVFIPYIGIYGATIATLIAFWVQWIIANIIMRKNVLIEKAGMKEIGIYSLLIIQMILAYRGNQYLLIEGCILLLITIFQRKEIKYLIELSKKMMSEYKYKKSMKGTSNYDN